MWDRRLVRDDRQIDAFAGFGRGKPEMVHRQAFGGTPVDTKTAPDARSFVDDHGGSVGSQLRARQLGQLDIVIDRVDAIGRDHLDAVMRADIDTAVTKDAAMPVDEDVQLALQTPLGFFEPDRLGEAHFDFEGRIARTHAAIRNWQDRHFLPADAQ